MRTKQNRIFSAFESNAPFRGLSLIDTAKKNRIKFIFQDLFKVFLVRTKQNKIFSAFESNAIIRELILIDMTRENRLKFYVLSLKGDIN